MPEPRPATYERQRYVFDSSAIGIYLSGLPGREVVSAILDKARFKRTAAYFTMFSLAEILADRERRGAVSDAQETWALIQKLPIKLIDIDRALAIAGAHIQASHSLNRADPFAAALAERQNAVLVTSNEDYKKIEKLVTIKWLPSGTHHDVSSEKGTST